MSPDGPLRVLLVPSAYHPRVGGIEELTRQLALHLDARGHRVLVLTNRWPATAPASELLDGLEVRRIPMELPAATARGLARFAVQAPRSAASFLSLVRRFRPHVVHLQGAGPNAAYAAALRPLLGAPVVLTAQGEFRNDAHGAFDVSLSLRLGLRSLLRHAAAVTAPSRFTLAELESALEVRAPREVVRNGVAPEQFRLARGEPNGFGRYLLAVGRLVEQKAFDVLLEAFAAVRPQLGGMRLLIGGDGPERARLERQAERLGLDGSVVFLGAVGRERVAELLTGAEAFALPSRKEAFGIALLEAMAAGTPAVAAAAGGIPEFVRDGDNALLVPVDDAGALASALVRLARDPDLRRRLAEGGRRSAAEMSWDRIAAGYERIYRRVIRG
jgi:glycogen(starch) synthase